MINQLASSRLRNAPSLAIAAGGNAMVFGMDGMSVEKLTWRRNLLLWSQDFSQAAWTKSAPITATPNSTTAPDGSNTGTLVTATGAGQATQAVTAVDTQYTFSVYVKVGDQALPTASFFLRNTTTAINLVVATITWADMSISGAGASIAAATGGWYRVTLTASSGISIGNTITVYAISSSGAQTCYLWGAQLEKCTATAGTYQYISDFDTEFLTQFPDHTLFQNSAGTTPVTGFGQPVGLMLDSSLGKVLGPEKVTGGDFEGGLIGAKTDDLGSVSTWTLNTTAPISGTQDGRLVVTTASASNRPYILFSANVSAGVIGKTYKVTFNYKVNSGVCIVSAIHNGTGTVVGVGKTLYGSGTVSIHVLCLGVSTGIGTLYFGNSLCDVQIDNYSIKEIPGYHAYQHTSSYRPLLHARYNLFTSTADITSSPSFNFLGGTRTGGYLGVKGKPTATVFQGPSTGVPASAVTCNKTYATYSVCAKYVSGASTRSFLMRNNTTATNFDSCQINLTSGAITNGGVGWTVTSLGNGWFRISYTRTTGITPGDSINLYYGSTGAVADTGEWAIDEPQITESLTVLPYQRVTSIYDYEDVGDPRHLQFDGVDDVLLITSPSGYFDGIAKTAVFGIRPIAALSTATSVFFGRSSADWYCGQSSGAGSITSHINAAGTQRAVTFTPAATWVRGKNMVASYRWTNSGGNILVEAAGNGLALTPGTAMPLTDGLTANVGGVTWALGSFATTSGYYASNRLYGLVICMRTMTDAELRMTERWITNKAKAY